jgi:hypothetical protein
MAFDVTQLAGPCTVCSSPANILRFDLDVGEVLNCLQCGDFEVPRLVAENIGLPFTDPKARTIASYNIRKMQKFGAPRPKLSMAFFDELKNRSLPTPAEIMDNVLLLVAEKADESPGKRLRISFVIRRAAARLPGSISK